MRGIQGWWERMVAAAGAGLVLLLPLSVDIATAGPFRTPKSLLANVLWAVLAAAFLARPSWDPWLAPAAAVAAAALLSALASTPAAAWAAIPWVLATLGFGALRQLGPESRKHLARAVVFSGAVQALVAAAFYDPRGRPGAFRLLEASSGRYQWLGTMGNPADVATFLALPTLLAFAWSWTRKRRALWLVLALVQTAVLVATQTLSVLAALFAGLAVLALAHTPTSRRLRVFGGLFLVAVLFAVAVTPIRLRLLATWGELESGQWLWLASARGAAWSSAVRMFAAHPLFGVGFGQFEAHSFRFLTTEELAQRGRFLGLETGFGEAHNELFQYLAETGLAGLLLLAGGLGYALRARRGGVGHGGPRRDGRGGEGTQTLSLPAAPLLSAAAVIAFFQFPLHLAAIAAQWAVVAALLLPPTLPPAPRRAGMVVGLALALLVALGSFLQWRAYRAVASADVLVSLLRQRPRDAERQVLAFEAYRGLQAKLRFLPWDYRAQTSAGNLAQESGDLHRAVTHFTTAVALAERPETRFNLGVVLMALGNEGEGLSHLLRAVELNPAILMVVSDSALAEKLAFALDQRGYFARFPWAREWLRTRGS